MVAIIGNEESYYQRVGVTKRTKNTKLKEDVTYEKLSHAMQADTSSQVNTQTHSVPRNEERETYAVPKPSEQASAESFVNLDGIIDGITKVRWKSR